MMLGILLSEEKAKGIRDRKTIGGIIRLTFSKVFSAKTDPDLEADLNHFILLVIRIAILLTIQPNPKAMPMTITIYINSSMVSLYGRPHFFSKESIILMIQWAIL